MDSEQHIYQFGSFRIDAVRRTLWRDRELLQLTSKSVDTLLVLIEHGGELVTKDDLMKTVWPDTIVEENNLTQQISMLRKVLGEKVGEHRYIVTVPGRGYKFVADVVNTRQLTPRVASEPSRQNLASEWRPFRRRLINLTNQLRSRVILSACFAFSVVILVAYGISWRHSRSTIGFKQSRSIAVMPFKPMTSDPANVYLSTGMADALIARLSNLRQISVRPTSSIIKYAEQQTPAQDIGRELDVDSVLEGTVQKLGQRVRVTVQLVNVESGTPVWAQTFDQEMTDIFAVQDLISEQVAQNMMLKLNGEDRKQIAKHATENVAAYQAYLEGRYFWNARSKEGLTKSVSHFQRAIDMDPSYAQAYSGLADAYTLLVSYGIDSVQPEEGMQKARAAAVKALGIDESLAEAHASLAMIKARYDRDEAGAEVEYQRAIELNPAYATAHHWYSEYLVMSGRELEAFKEIKAAQALDPLSPVINTTLGEHLYYARRYDEAIIQIRRTLEISPNFASAHFILGLALEQRGDLDEAISELQKARAASAINHAADASLAHSYALAGRPAEARRILRRMLERDKASPYEIAMVYQGLGEKEQVLDWLEKGDGAVGELNMLLRLDPRLDNLRSDPRFKKLLS